MKTIEFKRSFLAHILNLWINCRGNYVRFWLWSALFYIPWFAFAAPHILGGAGLPIPWSGTYFLWVFLWSSVLTVFSFMCRAFSLARKNTLNPNKDDISENE